MNLKADLKRDYLQNPPPAGIYKITNTVNGKILVGKGLNVNGILNSQQSQLKWGGHMNPALQEDWNQFGAENFTFEVVDTLEPSNNPNQNPNQELEELFQLWLEKLHPYGDRGYNRPPKG